MSKNINARIALKRDTSANWTNYNPVLLNGELILADTDNGLRAKIGDGIKTYTQLPFTDEALRALITDVDNNNSAVVVTKDGESRLLDTFNIIKLTQEEYDELEASDSLDPDALYLTEGDGDVIEPLNLVNGSAEGSLRSIYSSEESDSYTMGNYAVALGYNTTASDLTAHAEGYGTTASRGYSHAEGYETTASGGGSHAEGFRTTASGGQSHAEGSDTTASESGSHAEGKNTTASGEAAHAEGYLTTASNTAAHAEGYRATAAGEYSHAEGYNTTASGEYQHVQGRYNISDADSKYAHIVGNGYLDQATFGQVKSNAHTIDWDGVGWFAGDVYVGGTSQDDGDRLIRLSEQMTEDDALELLAETGIIDPITNENGAIFTDENGAIYVL